MPVMNSSTISIPIDLIELEEEKSPLAEKVAEPTAKVDKVMGSKKISPRKPVIPAETNDAPPSKRLRKNKTVGEIFK